MAALPTELRAVLSRAVTAARGIAESAASDAVDALGLDDERPHSSLSDEQRELRRGLQVKARHLGGSDALVGEIAYEQWHRMLFARFLAENDLLMHPTEQVSVSLADCREFAADLGEPDEWMVAARFAGQMLPGVFRSDDPSLRVKFAQEGRAALERILAELPSPVFTADDSLGWVYQFWQAVARKAVNASERKIGGADLAPVTQLFTEHYMVQFLLQNSLGAWWAGRHPDSPLLGGYEYLRRLEDGSAAGTFEGWPARVAEVTVIDPCCGSGHFLVEAFEMLRTMRMEEEELDATEAGNAVVRDNLFGLELDARCTQIAAFAVALAAWKSGGYRELPQPNIACSGIRVEGQWSEWQKLAGNDAKLEAGLRQLFDLFRHAPDIGSLIDPVRELEREDTLMSVPFNEVEPLLEEALVQEVLETEDRETGVTAAGIAQAAAFLARCYTLIATNVPYLARQKQNAALLEYGDRVSQDAKADLAVMFVSRCLDLAKGGGTCAVVTPQNWLVLTRSRSFRVRLLSIAQLNFLIRLGPGAFAGISGEVVQPVLICMTDGPSAHATEFLISDLGSFALPVEKARALQIERLFTDTTVAVLASADQRFRFSTRRLGGTLAQVANAWQGISTSDGPRFIRFFWEVGFGRGWVALQSRPERTQEYGGRSFAMLWEDGHGRMTEVCQEGAPFRGRSAWDKRGVSVGKIGSFPCTLYTGEKFDSVAHAIVPFDPEDLPPLWEFCKSGAFAAALSDVDASLIVTNATLNEVPFDLDRWRSAAEEAGPLPEPISDDPTQWLFKGHPRGSSEPLQVAVGRLVGFRWPNQEPDDLDDLVDADGLVSLPAMPGELGAAERVRQLLERAYGDEFSQGRVDGLLAQVGAARKSLGDWLRDGFFEHHCKVFGQRPFVWHIWDGRKDGFSVLVNYHRLNRQLLEKLTYTVLGDWIQSQQAAASAGTTGADVRLAAAQDLQRRLVLIREGEAPYDIYVRWKDTEQQPMGWEPDLDDGVRLNIRPFVEAGVLRKQPKVKWTKDRGKNPDGSERLNDLHLTLAEKSTVRRTAS
jgi:hypothetical protein